MAFREVTMVEIKEALRQWLAGVGKKRIAARPSRPSPHIATRAEPRSAARIEHCQKPFGNPVRVPTLQQGAKVGWAQLA